MDKCIVGFELGFEQDNPLVQMRTQNVPTPCILAQSPKGQVLFICLFIACLRANEQGQNEHCSLEAQDCTSYDCDIAQETTA